jgi:hypothetical protein
MTEVLSLAPAYGCANVNGTPDLDCICTHKRFKLVTKARILNSCPDPAELDTAKEAATQRCVAGKSPHTLPSHHSCTHC